MKRIRKIALGLAGAGALSVGVVGLLHTEAARPLLQRVGGCPVGKVAPAVVEKRALEIIGSQRGQAHAPARPALGFQLDRTTIGDVRAWAKEARISCTEKREETLVLCADVPATALRVPGGGIVTEVAFAFRVQQRTLLDVTTLRSHLTPAEASQITADVAGSLERTLGAPTTKQGDPSVGYFTDNTYATFAMNYRFDDYFADVTTMSLPAGVAVREQYLSAL